MTVKRLRPLPSPDELAAMYPEPHDHRLYGRGHDERVEATIALATRRLGCLLAGDGFGPRRRCADLSCGNGEIAKRISFGADLHLGDFAPTFGSVGGAIGVDQMTLTYSGPIEETVHAIPHVNVFVCSETIEHLDDPGKVLALIRTKADHLVLSTPLDCWHDDNDEHLWAWDRDGVEDLMARAGWMWSDYTSVDSREYLEPYLYGIWVAR